MYIKRLHKTLGLLWKPLQWNCMKFKTSLISDISIGYQAARLSSNNYDPYKWCFVRSNHASDPTQRTSDTGSVSVSRRHHIPFRFIRVPPFGCYLTRLACTVVPRLSTLCSTADSSLWSSARTIQPPESVFSWCLEVDNRACNPGGH